MAQKARQRQKAAEKRNKRTLKMKQKRAGGGTVEKEVKGPAVNLSELPIVECSISEGWQERGLAHILITRKKEDEQLVVAGFYVDIFCLGLKDTAFIDEVTEDHYEENIRENIFNDEVTLVKCKPELARAVVEGAIEFAEGFGFKPNKRWPMSKKMFEGIKVMKKTPTFGRDSKPLFIDRGETNAKGILARLERGAGPGNYLVEKAPVEA